MLKIAICEDEPMFGNKLELILLEIAKKEQIQIDIDVYQSGTSLLKGMWEDAVSYDIIFLDIEMDGIDGLETAKEIRKKNELVLLIYVTSHKSYAIEAYEVQPFRFVVKPIDEQLLYSYFMKAFEKISSSDFYFTYKFQRDYYKIPVRNILYFESEKRVIMRKAVEKYHGFLDTESDEETFCLKCILYS